jgi:signal transduction histidine kinase
MTYKATDGHVRSLGGEATLSTEVRTSSVISALVLSPRGEILAANDCLLRLVGLPISEVLDRDVRRLLLAEPADWEPWEVARRHGHANGVAIRLRAGEGRTIHLRGDIRSVALAGNRACLSGLFIDETASMQLDNTLNHAARMEAVAGLTSGIAHDFSNLLTVLVGNLYLVSEQVRDRAPLYEKIKLTRDAAKRGVDLIKLLLAFARNEKAETGGTDPKAVLERLGPLLKRALGSRITLETNVASEVAFVKANSGQLESVIVNLAINARDAIEANGTIKLGAQNAALDERQAAACGLPAGEYVRISITDNGSGIPTNLLDRVFEPFFSTKGSGKGTGLGLTMVRRFATDAGGTVELKSVVGKGTAISLVLPAIPAATTTSTSTMPVSTLPGGKETVLVFAENDEISSMINQILGVLGYRVINEKRVGDAIDVIRTAAVHLVLVDINESAHTAAHKFLGTLTELKPNMKVVAIRDHSTPLQNANVASLLKPFDLAGLADTVRKSLDGGKHG